MKYALKVVTDKNTYDREYVLESGENIVVTPLQDETIQSIQATMSYHMEDEEVVFMNGYQTWTSCRELRKNERMRGVNHLPKFVVNQFSLDRYGDYHFIDYENEKGFSHGFSYCYFRKGERYRFFGSLDENPGYTVFHNDANTDTFTISRDCKDIHFTGDYHCFDLFYMEGNEDEVFDAYFKALGITPKTDKKICGYSSWYNRYQNISYQTISEDLLGAKKILREGDVFQIDDGWEPFIGDWLEPDKNKFPNGLKPMVDEIHENGYIAGLWLAPFVAEEKSEIYQKHRDWFFQVDGNPWKLGCNWSGFYALDIDHPEVKEYLTKVFDRVFNEWGIDLVKLDFLYGGAPFGTKDETRAARMIRGCKWIRELCKDKLILGCGVPLWPTFGLFEYSRVSCDVSLDWDDKPHMRIIHRERPSTKHAISTSLARRQLNGRAFLNDPDVFFLRDKNLNISTSVKDDLAKFDAFVGGVFMTSDNPNEYSDELIEDYNRYRSLMDAKNIRYDIGNHISIIYELDGIEYIEILF